MELFCLQNDSSCLLRPQEENQSTGSRSENNLPQMSGTRLCFQSQQPGGGCQARNYIFNSGRHVPRGGGSHSDGSHQGAEVGRMSVLLAPADELCVLGPPRATHELHILPGHFVLYLSQVMILGWCGSGSVLQTDRNIILHQNKVRTGPLL